MEFLVRRLLLIQRWGNTVSAQANNRIQELFLDVVAAVVQLGGASGSLHGFRAVVEPQIDTLIPAAYEDVLRIVRDGATEFGVQQARAAGLQLRAALGAGGSGEVEMVAVSLEQIRQIVTADPIIGAPLEAWYRGQSERVRFNLKRQVQLGITRGETIDDMVRRIRGRHTGRYRTIRLANGTTRQVGMFAGGVLTTSTREAEAIARTAVNFVSNRASLEAFRANADVAPHVRYTATLDSRVSVLCASLDSKEWATDDPTMVVPPTHPNCRSVLVPAIDWNALGLDPPPEGTRASKDGQVSADLSAEEWLLEASQTTQDDVLGPTRAKLFRERRLSLRELVRTDGRIVSLEDLRES
jgi:SPP1 gp7 family putative phage head morphogenesis protein